MKPNFKLWIPVSIATSLLLPYSALAGVTGSSSGSGSSASRGSSPSPSFGGSNPGSSMRASPSVSPSVSPSTGSSSSGSSSLGSSSTGSSSSSSIRSGSSGGGTSSGSGGSSSGIGMGSSTGSSPGSASRQPTGPGTGSISSSSGIVSGGGGTNRGSTSGGLPMPPGSRAAPQSVGPQSGATQSGSAQSATPQQTNKSAIFQQLGIPVAPNGNTVVPPTKSSTTEPGAFVSKTLPNGNQLNWQGYRNYTLSRPEAQGSKKVQFSSNANGTGTKRIIETDARGNTRARSYPYQSMMFGKRKVPVYQAPRRAYPASTNSFFDTDNIYYWLWRTNQNHPNHQYLYSQSSGSYGYYNPFDSGSGSGSSYTQPQEPQASSEQEAVRNALGIQNDQQGQSGQPRGPQDEAQKREVAEALDRLTYEVLKGYLRDISLGADPTLVPEAITKILRDSTNSAEEIKFVFSLLHPSTRPQLKAQISEALLSMSQEQPFGLGKVVDGKNGSVKQPFAFIVGLQFEAQYVPSSPTQVKACRIKEGDTLRFTRYSKDTETISAQLSSIFDTTDKRSPDSCLPGSMVELTTEQAQELLNSLMEKVADALQTMKP